MIKRVVTVIGLAPINLGYVGDDMCTTIRFPISSIISKFGGDGTFYLLLSSPNGEKAHIVDDITRIGKFVEWVVPKSELEVAGNGEAQLVYTDGHGKTHSNIWETKIKKSLIKIKN